MTTNEPQGEGLKALRRLLHVTRWALCPDDLEKHAVYTDLARAEAALSVMATLEAERDQLREALAGIIEIGKRDMSNPKYDSYLASARAALNAAKGRLSHDAHT